MNSKEALPKQEQSIEAVDDDWRPTIIPYDPSEPVRFTKTRYFIFNDTYPGYQLTSSHVQMILFRDEWEVYGGGIRSWYAGAEMISRADFERLVLRRGGPLPDIPSQSADAE